MVDQARGAASKRFSIAGALAKMLCPCISPRQNHGNNAVKMFEVADKPAKVREGLFIGSWDSESDKELLDNLGITHVLQVGEELRPSFPDAFVYHQVPIQDSEEQDLISHLNRPLDFIGIARQQGSVLVHCRAGISRSAALVIAYLMYSEKLAFKEAAEAVKTARPLISPNPGFVVQLKEWERLEHEFEMWQGWSGERFLESRRKVSPLIKLPSHLKRARIPSVFSLFESESGKQQQQQQQQEEGVDGAAKSVSRSGFSIARILSLTLSGKSLAGKAQQQQQQQQQQATEEPVSVERSRLSVSRSPGSVTKSHGSVTLGRSPVSMAQGKLGVLEGVVRSGLSITRAGSVAKPGTVARSGGSVTRSAGSLSKEVTRSDNSKGRLQVFVDAGPAERRALLGPAAEVDVL